ncbi:hypothetical protein SAMN06265339_0257 [Desulfurobacterium pacificum]|uniref:POTRA domain-containing protein n=1 Tax=Desulfurobacterium pacificum TaxID=240166 RepID=A0ABY1NAJ4_9BACT|nr:hypothetical protein [Desulfurobacterium pacificum]SMP04854.1 hypothetical protein SAMN06265339_0257 [Desulfurobacterium pacificum]
MNVKKRIVLAILVLLACFTAYTVINAPGKLQNVEIKFNNVPPEWKPYISQYIFSVVKLGEELNPQEIKYLKSVLSSLPWIKGYNISLKGNVLEISLEREEPSYFLITKENQYLIGRNGFVLEKNGKTFKGKLPAFYYYGKVSPFTLSGEFVKIKPIVAEEIKLLKNRLKEAKIKGEIPQVTITDVGIVLVYRKNRLTVYLDNNENSWSNFKKFTTRAPNLSAGVYDFRFHDLLVEGRKEKCLTKKS